MNRDETKLAINAIIASYSRHLMPEISPQYIDWWHKNLCDMEANLVFAIIAEWTQNEKYPPSISDIRKRATPEVMDAKDAWNALLENIREYGYYRRAEGVKNLPEPLRSMIDVWGYESYCMMLEEDITTHYAQFRDAYNSRLESKRKALQTSPRIQAAITKLLADAQKLRSGLPFAGTEEKDGLSQLQTGKKMKQV